MSFAHISGPTLCLWEDKYVYTGGADNLVNRFDYLKDKNRLSDEPKFLNDKLPTWQSITCLKYCEGLVVFGTQDGVVQSVDGETLALKEQMTRATLPINDLCVIKKKGLVVAALEECEVRLMDVKDDMERLTLTCKNAVMSVAVDSKEEYLAVLEGNGDLKLWPLNLLKSPLSYTDDTEFKEAIKISKAVQIDEKVLGKLQWQPNGTILLIPGSDCISFYDLKVSAFIHKIKTKVVTSAQWSPNGRYVVYGTEEEKLYFYDFEERRELNQMNFTKMVTGISWNLNENKLVVTTRAGEIEYISEPIVMITDADAPHITSSRKAFQPIVDDDDDDEDLVDDKMFLDHEADDLGLDDEDDVESIKEERPKSIQRFVPAPIKKIRPFQPNQTPEKDFKLFLDYTNIGMIVKRLESDGTSNIDVLCHDRSAAKPQHFFNNMNLDKGRISEHGSLFSSPPTSEAGSILHYKSFQGSQNDWLIQYKTESVLAIAMDARFCYAGLNDRFVYVFSFGGKFVRKFGIVGDIVSISANNSFLMVVYQKQNSEVLEFTLINMNTKKVLCKQEISSLYELKWIQVTDQGVPCLYNSNGELLLHFGHCGYSPTILFKESTLGPNCFSWPIQVDGKSLKYILCKKNIPFPYPSMTPFMEPVDLIETINFEGDTENNPKLLTDEIFLDELKWRKENGLIDDDEDEIDDLEAIVDKGIIETIQSSMIKNKTKRVLDLCSFLHTEKSFNVACRLAHHYNKGYLIDKINSIKDFKLSQMESSESEDDHEEANDDEDELVLVESQKENRKPEISESQVESNKNSFVDFLSPQKKRTTLNLEPENSNVIKKTKSQLNPFSSKK